MGAAQDAHPSEADSSPLLPPSSGTPSSISAETINISNVTPHLPRPGPSNGFASGFPAASPGTASPSQATSTGLNSGSFQAQPSTPFPFPGMQLPTGMPPPNLPLPGPSEAFHPQFAYGVPLTVWQQGMGYPLPGVPPPFPFPPSLPPQLPPGVLTPPPPPYPSPGLPPTPLRPPAGTRVEIASDGAALQITIPAAGFRGQTAPHSLFTLGFAVVWLSFVVFWMTSAGAAGAPFFALFGLPFLAVGAALLYGALQGIFQKERLSFTPEQFRVERALFGWETQIHGYCQDISCVDLRVTGYTNGAANTTCVLSEGVRDHCFGQGLTGIEQQWLVSELAWRLRVPMGPGLMGYQQQQQQPAFIPPPVFVAG